MKFDLLAVLAGSVYSAGAAQVSWASLAFVNSNNTKGLLKKIVPKLEDVSSDEEFFGPPFPADYPHDSQPELVKEMAKKRSEIYPKVREHGFLDHDYVKDENSDGGEWQAQMAYDRARIRVSKEDEQRKAAKERADRERRKAEDARKKKEEATAAEDAANQAAADADKEGKDADQNEKNAEKNLDKALEDRKKEEKDAKTREENANKVFKSKEAAEKALKEAEEKFKQQEAAFKECQEKFEQAKKDLENAKKALAEFQQAHPQQLVINKVNVTNFVVNTTERLHFLKAQVIASKAKATAAKTRAEATDAIKKSAVSDLAWHKHESDKASEDLAKKDADLALAEAEFEKAKINLRTIRRPIRTPQLGGSTNAFGGLSCLVGLLIAGAVELFV